MSGSAWLRVNGAGSVRARAAMQAVLDQYWSAYSGPGDARNHIAEMAACGVHLVEGDPVPFPADRESALGLEKFIEKVDKLTAEYGAAAAEVRDKARAALDFAFAAWLEDNSSGFPDLPDRMLDALADAGIRLEENDGGE